MAELAIVQSEQSQRLEVILSLLDDNGVEDIVLNPDATPWAKQWAPDSWGALDRCRQPGRVRDEHHRLDEVDGP